MRPPHRYAPDIEHRGQRGTSQRPNRPRFRPPAVCLVSGQVSAPRGSCRAAVDRAARSMAREVVLWPGLRAERAAKPPGGAAQSVSA